MTFHHDTPNSHVPGFLDFSVNVLSITSHNESAKECVSIFLRTIVLETCSSTECVNSPICRVESSTSLFQRFLVLQTVGPTQQQDCRYGGQDQFIASPTVCRTIDTLVETSVSLFLLNVGLSTRWSRPVYRKSYFLQDQRYTSRDQFIVSPTFCRNIDTLVKTSVS